MQPFRTIADQLKDFSFRNHVIPYNIGHLIQDNHIIQIAVYLTAGKLESIAGHGNRLCLIFLRPGEPTAFDMKFHSIRQPGKSPGLPSLRITLNKLDNTYPEPTAGSPQSLSKCRC